MEEFKKDIELFVKCDNIIKDFNQKMSAMREQRETYSIRIMKFMKDKEITDTKLQLPRFNSTLKIGKHMNQENLSYTFLYNTFINYFGNPIKAEELLQFIKESRKKEDKFTLIRNKINI